MNTANRIVVTGASSFVGMHLARTFALAGWEVIATTTKIISQYSGVQRVRLDTLSREQSIRLEALDFTDASQLRRLIEEYHPNYWIHHAGWAQAYGSLDYDLATGLRINVEPLATLYELLAMSDCSGVIVTGSSAEYSDSNLPDYENDRCSPSMPYGLAKLAETLRAYQLAVQTNVKTRVARVYIPFGHYDAPEKLLMSVVSRLREEEPIELSPCMQKRDFLHVDDLVAGYQLLIDDINNRPEPFDIFNFCSGKPVELKKLLTMVADSIGAPRELLRFGSRKMRPGEPESSFGSATKSMTLLGWKASELEKSIRSFLH